METKHDPAPRYLDMELLRFTTAGSVDDGKSTLIGRLLYDSKSIFEDQLEAVELASQRSGNEDLNLALLTDGLRAEREQGITIDVAYRYFATPKRKFIIADTPGHIQYTRNMVTGASTADLAIILIDARNGVLEQTVRHSYIASLLRIPHILVCINKMDLAGYSRQVFDDIKEQYIQMSAALSLPDVKFIPISAKFGDNVVVPSDNMDWYEGPTLMQVLEQTPVSHKAQDGPDRLPVQYVIRPISDKFHDFRGYAGRMSGGSYGKGDKIIVLPSGTCSHIRAISKAGEELETAITPDSVVIELADDIDVSRGDMIVSAEGPAPTVSQEITATVCWLNPSQLTVGNKYIIRHTTRETVAIVKGITDRINVNTLETESEVESLAMNDIATVSVKTALPLIFDNYSDNHTTGSLIFIDPDSFETVGAGMITNAQYGG